MFVALAVGSGFALLMVPNVELITAVVFTAGVYLGPRWGLVVGGIAESIFSAANPLGSGLIFFPMFIAQVIGMAIVGTVAGLLSKFFLKTQWSKMRKTLLFITGALLTFQFDALTTLSYPISAGYPLAQTSAIFITGIGFTFLHQLANGIIFVVALPKVFARLKPEREE